MKKDFGSILDNVSKRVYHKGEIQKPNFEKEPPQDRGFICPNCKNPVKERWKVCPNCNEPIKCLSCDMRLNPDWKVCPGCQTSIDRPKREEVKEEEKIDDKQKEEEFTKLEEGHFFSGCYELDVLSKGGFAKKSVLGLTSEVTDTAIYILTKFLIEGIEDFEHGVLVTSNMNKIFEKVIDKYKDKLTLLLCDPSDQIFSKKENVLTSQLGATSINLGIAKIFMKIAKDKQKRLVLDLNELNSKEIPDFIRSLENKVRRYDVNVMVFLNPTRLSTDELASIVDLFDGDIRLADDKISIKKMTGEHYIRDEKEINIEKIEKDII